MLSPSASRRLARRLGLADATLLGLGAIVGTGIFVSLGVAAGVAGPAVIVAVLIAAFPAAANGLSSAQLAASHPVSGGTYEYGYRYLTPALGFAAGWMFVCAKTASAATAALGFASYFVAIAGLLPVAVAPLAATAVGAVTLLAAGGIRRSARTNALIVSITLLSLGAFCIAGAPRALANATANLFPFFGAQASWPGLLNATALMFVAYTGYGRIATLGEEVLDPRATIPKAVLLTLVISALLYVAVAAIAVAAVGAPALAAAVTEGGAPLASAAATFGVPGLPQLVTLGAMTALLGVLLNLVLGVSRVLLAMGRRGDLPTLLARVDAGGDTPRPAVLFTGLLIAAITLLGSVKLAWSFSAFTVLVYYAITNLAALRLSHEERLYPQWIAWFGLAACLSLAFFVEPAVWAGGLAILAAGLLWHLARRRRGNL